MHKLFFRNDVLLLRSYVGAPPITACDTNTTYTKMTGHEVLPFTIINFGPLRICEYNATKQDFWYYLPNMTQYYRQQSQLVFA